VAYETTIELIDRMVIVPTSVVHHEQFGVRIALSATVTQFFPWGRVLCIRTEKYQHGVPEETGE
jgi:hypothetical protein